MTNLVRPINWNRIEDQVDKDVWDKLTSNFWLPEKIPLAQDKTTWAKMTAKEQETLTRVFTGLTLLDTVQGTVGAVSLIPDSITPHEEAVYTQISFMESVHAKSYSTIFTTLLDTPSIDEAFTWSENNKYLQYKANKIVDFYNGKDPLLKKIASVLLESFLFYSGFYYIFHLSSRGFLPGSANIISLILRDEAVHGYYIGYKFQQSMKQLKVDPSVYEEATHALIDDLMENELRYTHDLYDELGLYDEVETFLRYNANKSLMNLGYESLYPKEDSTPASHIMAQLDSSGSSNHDFFSTAGSSYVLLDSEETSDEDWEF